jgi:hypothetical protein
LREERVERDTVLCELLNKDVGFFLNPNLRTKSCVYRVLVYLLVLTTVIYLVMEHIMFRSSLLGLSSVVLILLESVSVAL